MQLRYRPCYRGISGEGFDGSVNNRSVDARVGVVRVGVVVMVVESATDILYPTPHYGPYGP